MVIIYDSVLTEPPSSIYCFRDVTLFSRIFLNANNILKCPRGTRSSYWKWIKNYGAHDFIEEIIIKEEKQSGLTVGIKKNVHCNYINEINLPLVINKIKLFIGS